jgi:hypothetical protein
MAWAARVVEALAVASVEELVVGAIRGVAGAAGGCLEGEAGAAAGGGVLGGEAGAVAGSGGGGLERSRERGENNLG